MDILDDFTAVIYNTDDLATAVGTGYNFNLIYFGANITLTRGVSINPAKTTLTFDGLYLGNSYSFTDMNSTAAASTLNVWNTSSIAITIKNLTITGRNYYGVPYVREDVNNNGVSVTYENVRYSGIQLAYCPEGTVVFNNCDITITPPAGSTVAQEVGEVCRVEFAGTTVINHHSTSDAAFWFRGADYSPVLRLRPGAHVTITTDNYFMFNLVPAGFPIIQNPVRYELLEGSTLLLTSNHGISYNNTHLLSSFMADRNATFRYIQLAPNGTNESLYINGDFYAGEGSTVYMRASYTNARPLIRFMGNAALNIEDPLSFVLYNSAGAALVANTGVTRTFHFACNQLNRWGTATAFPTAGTLDDNNRPQWRKPDWSRFTVDGTIQPTQSTVTGSSFTADELLNLPALNTLQLHSAAVISLGDVPITMNPLIDDGRSIGGWSSPGAQIRIEYNVGGTDYQINLTADENGRFDTGETAPLPAGTSVTIWANTPFLIAFRSATVISDGDIFIERAPVLIRFVIDPIATTPYAVLPRENFDEPVVVVDNRADEGAWVLLAAIDGPMRTAEGNTIPDGLFFTDGSQTHILDGTPSMVYTGYSGGSLPGSTPVFWGREQGILLQVTQPLRSGQSYTAELLWSLHLPEGNP